MFLQEAKSILENKLTKMIASGLLSKDSIIKAGKAGMIPSLRRTTIGILKGTENKLKAGDVISQIVDKDLRQPTWELRKNIFDRTKATLAHPKFRRLHHSVLLKRHEADEALALKKQISPSQKKGRMISLANTKFINPKDGSIIDNRHASANVLTREKEIVNKISNLYPNSKLGKKMKSWELVRTKLGEYPAISKIKNARDIRKFDKNKRAWDD